MSEDAVPARRLFGWPKICRQCTRSCREAHAAPELLEYLGGVREPKGHSHKLKQSEWRVYSRFGNVSVFNNNLTIGSHEMNFGEDGGTVQGYGETVHAGYRLAVSCSDAVERSVVATWSPVTLV